MIVIEETDTRFYIKESTISSAGYGLFAAEHISKNEFLEIIGVAVQKGSISQKCTHYADSYKFVSHPRRQDRFIVPMGYAAIVNHTEDKKQQNVSIEPNNGAKRSQHACQMVYRFIRDARPDEEILGNYGDFWCGVLNWVEKTQEAASDISEDDLQTFFAHGLYNLDLLATSD